MSFNFSTNTYLSVSREKEESVVGGGRGFYWAHGLRVVRAKKNWFQRKSRSKCNDRGGISIRPTCGIELIRGRKTPSSPPPVFSPARCSAWAAGKTNNRMTSSANKENNRVLLHREIVRSQGRLQQHKHRDKHTHRLLCKQTSLIVQLLPTVVVVVAVTVPRPARRTTEHTYTESTLLGSQQFNLSTLED